MDKYEQRIRGRKKDKKLTIRYCHSCERDTDWKYDRVINHSRCSECGGMISSRPWASLENKKG